MTVIGHDGLGAYLRLSSLVFTSSSPMFEVLIAGMIFDIFPTYNEALRVASSLGCGATVECSRTQLW